MTEQERNNRTLMLIGEEGIHILKKSKIAVFGLGGVGSACAEALARCGVGSLALIDKDIVSPSNLNRQLIATKETVGQLKTEATKDRILSVSPETEIATFPMFYLPESADAINLIEFDYVLDCIDNVTGKLELISRCVLNSIPVLSCMGTGNRTDPFALHVCDIYETNTDGLARVMRKELRKRNIPALPVLTSTEKPVRTDGGRVPGSISFVPPVAGMMMASVAVRTLLDSYGSRN